MKKPNSLLLFDAALTATGYLERGIVDAVAAFVLDRQNTDGGFRGRGEESDLYYTAFALGCLVALGARVPAASVEAYLDSFGEGEYLDLVHLASLLRCRAALRLAAMPGARHPAQLRRMLRLGTTLRNIRNALLWKHDSHTPDALKQFEKFRVPGSGYALENKPTHLDSVYATYLMSLVYSDHGIPLPDVAQLARSVAEHQTPDGAFADTKQAKGGTTTVTAAAVVFLAETQGQVNERAILWLQARANKLGGFHAGTDAPIPDLLSTASALHALRVTGAISRTDRDAHTEFVEMTWQDTGGFAAHLADTQPDVEYTFYAQMALGHLLSRK